MSKDIANLLQIKLTAAYFQVGRGEDAHVERLPVVDEDPLPKVKLFLALDTKWPLNILLNHLLLGLLSVL